MYRNYIAFAILLTMTIGCVNKKHHPEESALEDFSFTFTVLMSDTDPKLALRKSGIQGVDYNVPTWLGKSPEKSEFIGKRRTDSQGGDGFDDRILTRTSTGRTANIFNAGEKVKLVPSTIKYENGITKIEYPYNEAFELSATVDRNAKYPLLKWKLSAKKEAYYSVVYTGSAEVQLDQSDEVWQPLIWTENRIPDRPYLTMAFRTPLPTTMVRTEGKVLGVLAHPDMLPFTPLPRADNSLFGVALLSEKGLLSPSIVAPVLGGFGSKLTKGEVSSMSAYLISQDSDDLTQSFESLSRSIYGFSDYRTNSIASINTALDNIVDYSMSEYGRWVESLRGFSYSTDVPGAVKNVSSLNALSLALVKDEPEMLSDRAIPLVEYMLSREKFLFSLDPEQKIQHPSRALLGPVAPVSELTALADILPASKEAFMLLAEREFNGTRERNLDVMETGSTWQNALAFYRVTKDPQHLALAKKGALNYINKRFSNPHSDFSQKGLFFWTAFAPDFVNLYQLWETTKDKVFLDAARKSARLFALHIWMSPKIPDKKITVNTGGKAPVYWYLKSKGHTPMNAAEETVPAWRLSEIGLTPESSGTSSGHRAIFMANFAPWMLKIGHASEDQFLEDIARSAIIGRYRNFPGYHINTARTTIYEKEDYPLNEHKALSVNSFHYNHILPKASMLLDWLVSEAYTRSNGQVTFPSQFIEGYAYLQNKFYGHKSGVFYQDDDVKLWMPKDLIDFDSVELNYVSGYKSNTLYLAISNQDNQAVTSNVIINSKHLKLGETPKIKRLSPNGSFTLSDDGKLSVTLPEKGFLALKIQMDVVNVKIPSDQSQAMNFKTPFLEIDEGDSRAFLLDFGSAGTHAFIHTRDDDTKLASLTVSYLNTNNTFIEKTDNEFPFEMSIKVPNGEAGLKFRVKTKDVNGREMSSELLKLE